jgi:hypothetical protein
MAVYPVRDSKIYQRHLAGETYAKPGIEFGISTARVRQVYQREVKVHQWDVRSLTWKIRRLQDFWCKFPECGF